MWKLTSDVTCSKQSLITRLSTLYAYSRVVGGGRGWRRLAVRQVFPAALLSPTLSILREREPDNTDTVKQGQGVQTSEALGSRPRLRASPDLAARSVSLSPYRFSPGQSGRWKRPMEGTEMLTEVLASDNSLSRRHSRGADPRANSPNCAARNSGGMFSRSKHSRQLDAESRAQAYLIIIASL
ncbi:hypothetical protein LA080_009231 [Diaporthe eres]|nr:hypothetical protein LA080_009231 [Diaporthe eres]